uniref:Inner centromere protein ARK-binding domain-containing protein n=1 Tax=Setaria italica TaxID=4555 RepID=K3YN04_SETIT
MEALFMQAFERRDAAEAQMRQQVASYSETLTCALLAAGHLPPPWLLPHPAALEFSFAGNTVRKLSVDLADLKSADHVHHVFPEINHWVKQRTADEAVEVKPVIMNINSSEKFNQCQKCTCKTVIDSTIMCVSETSYTAKTECLEDPMCIATPLLKIDSFHSVKPASLEGLVSVAATNPENDPIATNPENDSLELPHSMVSLLVEKGTLHSDKANFLEGTNSMACLLLDKEQILTDSLEKDTLHFDHCLKMMHLRLLKMFLSNPPAEKDFLHCVESDFLQGTYCMPSLLLDEEAGHTFETTSLEGPFCLVSPMIEKDPLNTIDHTEKLRKRSSLFDRCDDESSRTLEQQSSGYNVLPAPINESALQPYQLADNTSEARDEPALTDSLGGPHFLASPLLEKATLHCIQTQTDLDKILLKYTDDGEACQNSIVSSGTIISHNGSCIANAFVSAEIHCGDSSTGSAEDAFVCAESESAQMQSSLSKIPLECVKTGKAVEAQMASAAQFTLVESVQREPILDSIKCQPRQSDHAHANFPNKAGVLHTTESKITTNESLQTVNDKQNNSPETSCEHSCSSVSGEMFSSLESHVQRTASHLDKLSAREIQVNWNSSCEKVEMNGQSDDELYGSSSIMSTSSSLDNQDDYDQKKTRGNLSGKALPSLSCLSSNQTSPLTHEVQAAANYSPEKSMSNLSDAIHCSSPILQASLCSGSSLNTKVTTIPQHSRSYSLANNLDSAFASVAGFSDFQADGERCYIRQENSSVECPNGGLKTARAEDHSKFDETMQECKNFSIPVRSNSPTISDRAFQAFCESTKLINLSSSLSAKYKMKPLDGVYQSLPSKFEKLMNRSLAYSLDGNLLDQSHDSKKLRDFGKYSLDLDGVFMMSDDLIYGSSYAYGVQEDSDVPLTLLVEKYNLEKLSGRTGSSSGYLVSIPKLDCYRIDEDSTILGKNENQVNLSGPVGRKYSRQGLTAKKPLGYATNIYKSKGTSSLDLTAGKSYTRKPDRHVHIRANQDIKNPKDNCAPSIRKAGKVIHPLLGRLSKAEMSSCKSERNRSKTNLEKGFRPRNIVSNMTSFVPNVKQKQRPLTSCGKRDVRVRALEAAEAAKRREEKKQTEREKRKAAVALERERLKQEKEHRQEQVEQQKKRDADIITRKRQRENDGKRGNGRKTKCAEEAAPKRQKKLVEIMYSTNVMKDACPNNTDGKDMVEHLVKGVKNPLLSDERMESVHRLIASESNSLKCISADWKSEGYGLQVQESLSDNVDMYYEMSPYEDSDEGDIDELELKREIRRSCRLIPSWA